MGVLTDLVVAPLSDAGAVAASHGNGRTWPWADLKGLDVTDLATLHCLLDGADPAEPVAPPEWSVNPFTKKKSAVTTLRRYVKAFGVVAADGEVVVLQVPGGLTEALAVLDSQGLADLARRWSVIRTSEKRGDGKAVHAPGEDAAVRYLETAAAMARTATERHHELLVWLSP